MIWPAIRNQESRIMNQEGIGQFLTQLPPEMCQFPEFFHSPMVIPRQITGTLLAQPTRRERYYRKVELRTGRDACASRFRANARCRAALPRRLWRVPRARHRARLVGSGD